MTFLQLIGIIGAFTIFVFVSWWCINHDCSNNSQWQKAMEKMTEEKFPYMWKVIRPKRRTGKIKKGGTITKEDIKAYELEYEKFITNVRRVGKVLSPLKVRLEYINAAYIHEEKVICFIYFAPDDYGVSYFDKKLLTYTDDELEAYVDKHIQKKNLKN